LLNWSWHKAEVINGWLILSALDRKEHEGKKLAFFIPNLNQMEGGHDETIINGEHRVRLPILKLLSMVETEYSSPSEAVLM